MTAGTANASTTVWHGPASPVTASLESSSGIYGVFWQPSAGLNNHIGVARATWRGGGVDTSLGALFAARGYPLWTSPTSIRRAKTYRASPPTQTPKPIPLEYFANALHWLGSQPGVDRARLWIVGMSLGTEAALLTAAHFPNLVHGVVVFSPNDAATCGDANWTLADAPLPCSKFEGAPQQTDNPAAVIAVDQIRGPIEFVCGDHDAVWPSCPNSEAMMAELTAAHDRYHHSLFEYPQAGHGICYIAPYSPGLAPVEVRKGFVLGETPIANPLARGDQWPKLMAFLRN